jgi:flagellar biosynthetic protein FliQ
MEPEIFVDILSDALFLVIKLVSAIVIPGLLIGLVVAVFQAATSINEQTLSFLPRLLITIGALIMGGHWLTQELMDFFTRLVMIIPEIAG